MLYLSVEIASYIVNIPGATRNAEYRRRDEPYELAQRTCALFFLSLLPHVLAILFAFGFNSSPLPASLDVYVSICIRPARLERLRP